MRELEEIENINKDSWIPFFTRIFKKEKQILPKARNITDEKKTKGLKQL